MSKQVALRALVMMFGVVAMSLTAAPSAIGQEARAGAELNQDLYFDLDFPGGTLGQYLDAIRKAHSSANIIASDLSDEAKTARIPAMKLKDVTLGAAIDLAKGSTHNAAGETITIWYRSVDIAGRIENAYRVGAYAPLRAFEYQAKASSKSPEQQIKEGESKVWSLRDLVDGGMKMDDVLGAVRVALKTIGKPTEIQLHEPTSLLIVRGTKEQLELVDQAVSAMNTNAGERWNKATNIAIQLDTLQGELVKAEVERRFAQKKLEISSERTKSYQQNFEKRRPGLADDALANSENMLRTFELDVIVAEGKLQIAQDRVVRLQRQIGRLQMQRL